MRFETDRRWKILLQFSIRRMTSTLLRWLTAQKLVRERGENHFPLHCICQTHSFLFFLLLLFASNRGMALVQQGPPQRLNYWQWHLIYWEGGWQWIYFRSNCLYEESPWTLQVLGIQTRGDIWVLYLLRESFAFLHDPKYINANQPTSHTNGKTNAMNSTYHFRRDFSNQLPHSLYKSKTVAVYTSVGDTGGVMCSPTPTTHPLPRKHLPITQIHSTLEFSA